MGFLETASITVPDAEGETYVVISMQPPSDIRTESATVCRHFPMRGLTEKMQGRPEVRPMRRGHTLSARARDL